MDFTKKPNFGSVILTLLMIYLLSMVAASFFSTGISGIRLGNIALIRINAPIASESSLMFMDKTISSDEIIAFIDEAESNPAIKAILFEINSPGGTAVASAELMDRIKRINRTTASYIRELGVSGAYWAASATQRIFANSMSIVGSIGVYGSYVQVSGLMQRYNLTYQRLVSGKYKDIGSPLKELTAEERDIIQENMDEMHSMFIESVMQNRGLSNDAMKEIGTGIIYTGESALTKGLVDEIGGKEEAIKYVEKRLNITAAVAEYKKTRTFFGMLSELMSEFSFTLGSGISSGYANAVQNTGQIAYT